MDVAWLFAPSCAFLVRTVERGLMQLCLRLLFLALVVFTLGCGLGEPPLVDSGGEESAAVSPSGEPTKASCLFRAVVETEDGRPLQGLVVIGRASERVDERRWRGVAEAEATAAEDGSFSLQVPCGSSLALDFGDWNWPVEPARLVVDEGLSAQLIQLVPERLVMMRLESSPGRRIEGLFRRSAAPGVEAASLPIPPTGLQLEAVSWAGIEGTIEASGVPPFAWSLHRSHEFHEVAPDRFEVVMQVGPAAPRWLEVEATLLREIQGAWCLVGQHRESACKRVRGAWLCDCPNAESVLLTSDRWATGFVQEFPEGGLMIATLPEPVEQCFTGGAAGGYQVAPLGLSSDALAAVTLHRTKTGKTCAALPHGSSLQVTGASTTKTFVAGDGEVVLN